MKKILIYDIENTPNIAYVWGKWEQNVIDYVKEWEVLSVAYKWAGDKTVKCITREGEPTDRSVVEHLHRLFSEADEIVAHNGDQHDARKLRARMVYYNLPPLQKVKQVDTKKLAKRLFMFNGNGLNDLGVHLGLGMKYKHSGFELWKQCMDNDPKAWAEMVKYNKMDVVLLEKVYDRFKAWYPDKQVKIKQIRVRKLKLLKIGRV